MPRSAFVLAAALVTVGAVGAALFVVPQILDRRPAPRPSAAQPATSGTTVGDVTAADVPSAPLPEPARTKTTGVESPVVESVEALFERALRLADGQDDFKGAIVLLKQVVARQAENRALAARALYEIGRCLERMGRSREAREAFEMVLERFADQREAVHAACAKLPPEARAGLDYEEELRKRLREGRVDLDVVDSPIAVAVEALREQARINVLLDDREPYDGFEKKMTVRLWNVPIAEALDRVCSEASAAWYTAQGCVILYPKGCTWRLDAKGPPRLPDWEKDIPAWKQEEESMRTALAATPVSAHLCDASLTEMARSFQAATTRLIVVDDALARDADAKRVTFRVEELDPSQALDLICRMLDVAWYADRGTIHLTTQEAAEAWRKAHE